MSINEIYPMRKRRSVSKTPRKTPNRSSSSDVPLQTPKRITSNNSFTECDIVWDNHSPSPSRTLLAGKRKKKTVSEEDNNDIADLVKKLANKTGQTPQDSSLYNFWFNEQDSQSGSRTSNNNSGDKKKYMQTPAKRPNRKGRKSKARLNKELEVLASMMQNNRSNTNTAHNKEETPCASTHLTTATSPSTSYHQQTTSTSTTFNSKFKTPNHHKDAKKLKTTTTPKFSSPMSDIADIDWGDDDVDTMLSQVDISALYDQDVLVTNTQRSDSENADALSSSFKENQTSWNNDDSLVTESWDFDDDSEELLQTLEQVERTQSNFKDDAVNTKVTAATEKSALLPHSNQTDDFELFQTLEQVERMHNLQSGKSSIKAQKQNVEQYNNSVLRSSKMQTSVTMHKQSINTRQIPEKASSAVEQSCTMDNQNVNLRQIPKEKSSVAEQSSNSQGKSTYSKEDIERKRLEAQQKRKQRLKLTTNRMSSRQNTCRLKR